MNNYVLEYAVDIGTGRSSSLQENTGEVYQALNRHADCSELVYFVIGCFHLPPAFLSEECATTTGLGLDVAVVDAHVFVGT